MRESRIGAVLNQQFHTSGVFRKHIYGPRFDLVFDVRVEIFDRLRHRRMLARLRTNANSARRNNASNCSAESSRDALRIARAERHQFLPAGQSARIHGKREIRFQQKTGHCHTHAACADPANVCFCRHSHALRTVCCKKRLRDMIAASRARLLLTYQTELWLRHNDCFAHASSLSDSG